MAARTTRSSRAAGARDEDNSDGSEASSFFSPSREERGCPTCRKVPTDFLRLYPEIFLCTVCSSEDAANVFALIPCGHCLCGNCKDRWVSDPRSPQIPDISNLNISNNQGAAGASGSGRRGRPLTSPLQRTGDATRRRKAVIITAIENDEINNGVITDAIFYCDIPGTFQSPDEEPREVFRIRLMEAVNTHYDNDYDRTKSWVLALQRLSMQFDGVNPLNFAEYTVSMVYNNGTNISLRIPRIKGLNDKDVIESIDNYENIEIGYPPSLEEYRNYFVSNTLTVIDAAVPDVAVNVVEGDEIV
jgi:hypothetical protein